MPRQNKLLAVFNVHPGEGKMVLLLLGLGLLENFANVMARTTTYALFLAEFDAETLPYVYIGIAISATLVSYAYLKLTERLSLATVLLFSSIFLVLLLSGLWLGTTYVASPWVTFSLPIAFGILNTLMITAYWGLIGRVFNIQQGKRLTGLVATAETVAFMVGGFLMPLLVLWIGSTNILLVAAILMAISLGVLIYVNRFFAAQLATPPKREQPTETQQSAGDLLRSVYVRLIFGLFTLFTVGAYFVDNTFFALAEIQYPDADQLASFTGLFWGISSILVLLMQGFVSGRILVRFGVGVVMMLTPAVIIVETGAMSLIGALLGITPLLFWLGVMANGSRIILDATDQAAVNILYQPLPAEVRTRAQTMVNGIFYPMSIGLAGALLLLFRSVLHFDVVQSTYVLFLIALAWLGVAILLRRAYPQALLRALKRRDFGDPEHLVGDASSLHIFRQGLTNPHAGVVVYSLKMLEQVSPELMTEHLPQLLSHERHEVRLDVLQRIERLGLTSALPAIRERLDTEDSAVVRGAALRTMSVLCDDDDLFEEIYAYLDHPDFQMRQGALVGMLRGGQFEGIAAAASKLTGSLNSDDPAERGFAAQVLGEGGIRGFYRPLLKLLHDDEPNVRRLALVAAGKLGNPKLWPAVVENLALAPVRAAAVRALVTGGETVFPELRSSLVEADQTRPVLIRLIQVLARIQGKKAVTLLEGMLDFPDEQIRTAVLFALNKCGYRVEREAAGPIEQRMRAEVAQATWISATLAELGEDNALSLLRSSLAQHLDRHRQRLFLWCAIVYDSQVIQRVQDTLSSNQFSDDDSAGRQRSYALEAIDVLLPPNLKTLLLPLFEGLPPVQILEQLRSSFPQTSQTRNERLQAIVVGPDAWLTPWLKASALNAIARLPAPELAEAVLPLLASSEPLIRETAIWTLNRLDSAQYELDLVKLLGDPDSQVADTSRRTIDSTEGGETMYSTVEKVMALKALSLFAGTADEILAEVAAALKEQKVSAGEAVFEKGEVGGTLYMIAVGKIRIHDAERSIDDLTDGDAFGEMSILDPAPRSASATALQDSHLLCLDQESFRELLTDHSDVAWRVMQLLTRRLRHLMSLDPANQLQSAQKQANIG